MAPPSNIRELAQRAELEFHTRPHRFRGRAWWLGVVLALACCGWLAYAAIVGDHRLYEAGPLTHSHAFIANDCRQCHTSWQPALRLATGNGRVSSIDNAACMKCHAAAEHHVNQIPAHAELSCAECHREHGGQLALADVTDRHCIRCHGSLQTTDGPSKLYALDIRGFSEVHGHPAFNLTTRLASESAKSNLISSAELDALLKQNPTEGEYQRTFLDVLKERAKPASHAAKAKWRDRGEIKFNHAAHLDPVRIKDKTGLHVDLSQNCQACHAVDAAGRYMLPIKYEQHCAQCHPLWFDNENYASEVVPHGQPEVVRGFLTEKYTLAALKRQTPFQEHSDTRALPGDADLPALTEKNATGVAERVAQAERLVQDHTRAITGRGGCKLCHTVDATKDERWSVQKPDIPNRWMPHSRFDHAAHRMLACAECHGDVATKRDTADVMLPDIQACRTCHISGSATPRVTAGFLTVGGGPMPHDVKSSCTMCHTYHRKLKDEPSGQLDKQLQIRTPLEAMTLAPSKK